MALRFEPRQYQRIAADFIMANQRCNLWAVPGMGKTSTTFMVLDYLQLCGSNFFPALVIAPKRVASQVWPFECKKWEAFSGIRVVPVLGTVEEREDALLRKADVYVINYDNIQWLVNRLGRKWFFKIVVADESTRLKSFRLKGGGKRAKALSEIAEQTGRWINLTGTPATNGLKDLWGQNWFVDFGQRLGSSYTKFHDRWFYVEEYTKRIVAKPNAEGEIHDAMADVALALRAEDWLDVKKPHYTQIDVELPEEAQKQYNLMEDDYWLEIGDREIEASNAMVRSLKLLQMASGSVYDAARVSVQVHDAKLEALEGLIEELAGEPLMVAYHFKHDAAKIRAKFPEARLMQSKKDEDDWNAGKIPILLVHPQSAGHGLNLQDGGRSIVFYTNTWDLELRQQVIERLGPTRQAQAGHNRVVMIYDIVAKNTMDTEVLLRLSGKASVQEALMAARARRKGEVYVPSLIQIPENEIIGDLL